MLFFPSLYAVHLLQFDCTAPSLHYFYVYAITTSTSTSLYVCTLHFPFTLNTNVSSYLQFLFETTYRLSIWDYVPTISIWDYLPTISIWDYVLTTSTWRIQFPVSLLWRLVIFLHVLSQILLKLFYWWFNFFWLLIVKLTKWSMTFMDLNNNWCIITITYILTITDVLLQLLTNSHDWYVPNNCWYILTTFDASPRRLTFSDVL